MQSPLLTCPRHRPEHPHLTAQPQGLTLCVLDNAANNHVGAWHFIIWFPHTSIFPYLRLPFRNHKALSTTQRQDSLRLSGQLHKVSLLNPKLLLSVRQFTGRKPNCFFQVISHCKYWDSWNCSVTTNSQVYWTWRDLQSIIKTRKRNVQQNARIFQD